MEDILLNQKKTQSIYRYILEKINQDGALHFTLIDPDPTRQNPIKAANMAKYAEEAGSDAILIGGSTIFDQNFVDTTIDMIKKEVNIPIIIFPGGATNISAKADAIFFMSLLNSEDPYFIIGQQALTSYTIKITGLDYISMAYLIIEPGAIAGWIGKARLLPRKRPKLTTAYALAAEMFGFKMIYLEAGSGSERIPEEHIEMCSKILNIPLIVGGGVGNKEDAKTFVEAGADIVVMGTFLENNVLKDNGTSLKGIIEEIKSAGSIQKKNYSIN